jgi:hypothetical protein
MDKKQIMSYVRYAGVFALLFAFMFAALQWTWTALVLLLVTGLLDIALVIFKEDTISQWIHGLFPKQVDFVVVILIVVFTWLICGPTAFLPVMLGVIAGHLFWQD